LVANHFASTLNVTWATNHKEFSVSDVMRKENFISVFRSLNLTSSSINAYNAAGLVDEQNDND
jgi:hypothetical protein